MYSARDKSVGGARIGENCREESGYAVAEMERKRFRELVFFF